MGKVPCVIFKKIKKGVPLPTNQKKKQTNTYINKNNQK